jgi:outer membrane murein-binding lipoprotein Lpp
MSTKRPHRGRDFFVGGSITGGFVGDGNSNIDITIGPDVKTDSASLDDLREAIASLRAEVQAAGSDEPADSRVQYEPDGEAVRSRWKQVLKLLGPLKDLASVAQVTASMLALFSAN